MSNKPGQFHFTFELGVPGKVYLSDTALTDREENRIVSYGRIRQHIGLLLSLGYTLFRAAGWNTAKHTRFTNILINIWPVYTMTLIRVRSRFGHPLNLR
jgi:hypothetical protein